MVYAPRGQAWVDGPAAGNAIDAEDLNRLEANQADANTRLGAIEGLGSLATDAELAAHVAAADPHTGYVLESTAAELIRDTVGTALVAGAGLVIAPDDPGNTIIISSTVPVSAQAGAYTLALTDAGAAVELTAATSVAVTVPPNSSVAFPVGTVVEILQYGAGQVTVVAGAGVTIRTAGSLAARTQYSALSLRKRGTDEWVLSGDTA